jgi:transcriptional regulator with XRE-family HTH domain
VDGDFMDVGQRIQTLRVENSLSQEALAERLGVTRQSVSKWELGQALPDVDKIVQLSKLFNVTTDALLLDDDAAFSRRGKKGLRFGMYLIVKDFSRSVLFYEKLLGVQAFILGRNRFAQLYFDGICIAIMNERHLPGHDTSGTGDHKFVFNFGTSDLDMEHTRIRAINIGETTEIIHAFTDYYYFNVIDPDGNVVEITGKRSE